MISGSFTAVIYVGSPVYQRQSSVSQSVFFYYGAGGQFLRFVYIFYVKYDSFCSTESDS